MALDDMDDLLNSYPSPQDEEFFERELGRLTVAWASTEYTLYRVLLEYAQIKNEVGRAIFGGCRARDMIKYLKNIAHNIKLSEDRLNDLTYVFSQMNAINELRDQLVHHSTNSYAFPIDNPKQRILTNSYRVSKNGADYEYLVGSELIRKMCDDLRTIRSHLDKHWGYKTQVFTAHASADPKSWLFKSPPSTK